MLRAEKEADKEEEKRKFRDENPFIFSTVQISFFFLASHAISIVLVR